MSLVKTEDVQDLLPGYNLPASQLDVAMRMVAGWLREDSGRELPAGEELADTDVLWAPAVELVALVATNPELLAQKTTGPTSRSWPIAQRRDAIRQRVRDAAVAAASGPRGCFPSAPTYPDPVVQPVYTGWLIWP